MARKRSPNATPVDVWFASQGWKSQAFQREVWAEMMAGNGGLLNAPTGTGKTYAVFGGVVNHALSEHVIPALSRNREDAGRSLKLKDLYKGYKDLDKSPDEILTSVRFAIPNANTRFHFEKVSKRTHLDIASVNSAIRLELDGDMIREAHASAGGVASIPKYLTKTSAFLAGKPISNETVRAAIKVMNDEVAPISDARGTAEYKRLLLRQLFFAHFMELFPEKLTLKELVA